MQPFPTPEHLGGKFRAFLCNSLMRSWPVDFAETWEACGGVKMRTLQSTDTVLERKIMRKNEIMQFK